MSYSYSSKIEFSSLLQVSPEVEVRVPGSFHDDDLSLAPCKSPLTGYIQRTESHLIIIFRSYNGGRFSGHWKSAMKAYIYFHCETRSSHNGSLSSSLKQLFAFLSFCL